MVSSESINALVVVDHVPFVAKTLHIRGLLKNTAFRAYRSVTIETTHRDIAENSLVAIQTLMKSDCVVRASICGLIELDVVVHDIITDEQDTEITYHIVLSERTLDE